VKVFSLIMKQARVAGGDIFGYIADPPEMQLRAAAVIKGIEEGWLKMAPRTLPNHRLSPEVDVPSRPLRVPEFCYRAHAS
jgi:hypothetical protein